jgi:hypothetical protein
MEKATQALFNVLKLRNAVTNNAALNPQRRNHVEIGAFQAFANLSESEAQVTQRENLLQLE